MREAKDLQDARDKAEPGEYIMTRAVSCSNPDWCVMTEHERDRTPFTGYGAWITWEKK